MTYDAVVCVSPSHLGIASQAVKSLCLFSEARRVFVVTAPDNFHGFRALAAEHPQVTLVDENSVIEGITLGAVEQYMARRNADPRRAGWYFQQFLKMAMCLRPDVAEHYLIWDSDTIMLRPISFFDDAGHILVNPKSEFRRPYFELTKRLLGFERVADFSFISEHLMVRAECMGRLLEHVGKHPSANQHWVWAIMDLIVDSDLSRSGFSEYETYGNFVCLHYPDVYRCRRLKSLRRGTVHYGPVPNVFDLYYLMNRGFAFATFESWHKPSMMSCLYRARSLAAYSLARLGSGLARRPNVGLDNAGKLCRKTAPEMSAKPGQQAVPMPPLVAELLGYGPPSGRWLKPEFEPGLVSVIIPTYNNAHLIGETLASILAQTHDKVEVIVVDDGSTDNTQEVLAEWRGRFRAQKGWELKALQQAHRGQTAALNLGAKESRGEYINFFDSDDLMSAVKLASQVRLLREGDLDLVHGPHIRFYVSGGGFLITKERFLSFQGEDYLGAWLARQGLVFWTCLISRRFADKVGPWNERIFGGVIDAEYHARLLLGRPKMSYCPDGPVFYRRHFGSVTFNYSPRAHSNAVYCISYMEKCLEQDGRLAAFSKELARKFRLNAVNSYRDAVNDVGDYCAAKAAHYDPEFAPKKLVRRLAFGLGGLRLALYVEGRAERWRWRRMRLAYSLGLSPKMEPATWVAELPLQPAAPGGLAATPTRA